MVPDAEWRAISAWKTGVPIDWAGKAFGLVLYASDGIFFPSPL